MCVVASSLAGNNILTTSVNFCYYRLWAVPSIIRAAVLNARDHICAKKNTDLLFWDWLNCSEVYSTWEGVLYFEKNITVQRNLSFALQCLVKSPCFSFTSAQDNWLNTALNWSLSNAVCSSSKFGFGFLFSLLTPAALSVGGRDKKEITSDYLLFSCAVWPQSDSF